MIHESGCSQELDHLAGLLPDTGLTSENAQEFSVYDIPFSHWISSNVKSSPVAQVLASAVKSVMAADATDYSLLYFLWILKSCGGYRSVMNTQGGAQQDKIKTGAFSLCNELLKSLSSHSNIQIICDQYVTKVYQSKDKVLISTSKDTFEAKYCISAIPIAKLAKISFEPALPTKHWELIQGLEMGSVIKFLIFYENSFWREQKLSGEILSDADPLSVVMEYKEKCLVGYIFGANAKQWSKASKVVNSSFPSTNISFSGPKNGRAFSPQTIAGTQSVDSSRLCGKRLDDARLYSRRLFRSSQTRPVIQHGIFQPLANPSPPSVVGRF